MKNKILILAGLALLALPLTQAHAYQSGAADPKNGNGNAGQEIETKQVVKSATAGSSDAISAGDILGYDPTAKDGYTVTKSIAQTRIGLNSIACVALDSIATGDTGYHACAVKGFVKVPYNGNTYPIEAGYPVCLTSKGVARGCSIGIPLEATSNSGIIPLSSKTDAASDLPVLLNLR